MFGAPTWYLLGDSPYGIAIADLNEDGWSDLVVANARDTTLSVLLGRGDGSFGSRRDFSAGAGVGSVAIADLNGDGHLDVAAAAPSRSRVSVFFGLGDGTLGSRVDHLTMRGPVDVDIGDLNGDGWPDLVTANAGHARGIVSVILGTGNGGFASATRLDVGWWPNTIAIKDLNVDGRPDLIVTDDGRGSISVLLGGGDGTFLSPAEFSAGNGAHSLATDDLNGDGRLDAVVAVYPNRIAVLLGDGEGSLGPPQEFAATSPSEVAMADLNGDGRVDLAATNGGANSVSVLLGNGDGTFGPMTDYPAGNLCASVEIGDFNGDGRPDLAVTNASGNAVAVLLNLDAVTATGVSVASAWAEPGLVRVVWYAGGMPNVQAVVERRTDTTEWRTGSTMTPDGTRRLILEDRRVEPGVRYGYRLRINVDGQDEFAGEVWVEVPQAPGPEPGPGPGPGAAFALHGFVPNPAEGELAASFSLPDDRPASLELFDVAGRRVWSWDVGSAGPGSHWIRLGARGTPPGVYVLRLTRGAEVLTARGLLLK